MNNIDDKYDVQKVDMKRIVTDAVQIYQNNQELFTIEDTQSNLRSYNFNSSSG